MPCTWRHHAERLFGLEDAERGPNSDVLFDADFHDHFDGPIVVGRTVVGADHLGCPN